ncbi:hypothetical protein STEG23_017225, partial [Scotinomys teguina]
MTEPARHRKILMITKALVRERKTAVSLEEDSLHTERHCQQHVIDVWAVSEHEEGGSYNNLYTEAIQGSYIKVPKKMECDTIHPENVFKGPWH